MGKKFKKFIATSIVVLAGTILISCGEKNYRVSFNLSGGSAVESQVILENGLVTAPENPTKENAIFAGWFKDSACTKPWNFSEDKVTADTIIFAKWIESSEIILPDTTLENYGYTLSVVGGATNVSINGNFELKLEVNTDKFIVNNLVLLRNGDQVETPVSYDEEDGKRIYTYTFTEIRENQEFSVIGLVPKFYIAVFDASEFYTISDIEGVRTAINHGSDYSFKINLLEGYTDSVATMSVWNGQTRLYPDNNGIYTIENVTTNLSIDITNIYKNIYTVSYPASSMQRFEVSGFDTTFHGEELSFKIKLAEQFSKTEVDKLLDIKIAGISVAATYVFDISSREYTFTIPADKVKGNINIALNDSDWEIDKYIISFPSEMIGYSLTSDFTEISAGKYEVSYGEDFEFYVKLDKNYKYCQTFKVMAGNFDLTRGLYETEDDKLKISNIKSDYEIRLENLTKNSYTIEVPENAGYEIVLADGYSLPAEEGSEVKFDIRVLEETGYELVVPDLGALTGTLEYYDNPYTSEDETKELSATPITIYKNGHYVINSISGNIKLNITGIEKKKFTTSVSEYDGFKIENMPESLTYGETYTFDVVVDEDYLDSLNNNEIKAKVNGKILSSKNNFDENKITFTITINDNLVSYIGSSKVIPIEITGVAKNYYNITFSLDTSRVSGGYFKNFESLGEGYTENSYTISVKRGANGTINSIAPTSENIIVPEHYEINSSRPWQTNKLININEITSDIIFYVDFTPIKYEIGFILNGGVNAVENNTNGGIIPKYTYDVENPINLADPSKEITENSGNYYDFLGWFVEEDGEIININDFKDFKNITVTATWGIKVGENEIRKTIAEATSIANSGDKIIVLESATLGDRPSIASKELELVGENENVKIFVDSVSNLNGGAAYGYSLINITSSDYFKISNIIFELDESISENVVAFNITRSNAEISNVSTKNMGLMKTILNAEKVVLVDNVSVEDNKNNYAVTAYSDNAGELIIRNSNFNVFKGILVEANETYLGSLNVTIENNAFEKVALAEEIENEVSIDIKVIGMHEIQTIENTHNNTQENGEFVIFENGLADILVKEDIESLISKISVNLESGNASPIRLYTITEVIVDTDNYGGQIREIKKTNEVLYNFINETYETTIYYGTETDISNALEFSKILNLNLDINSMRNTIEINSAIEIPESVEVWVNNGTISVLDTGSIIVNGILNTYGNILNEGIISVGPNGEIVNHQNIKLGTSYEIKNVISKLDLELGENNTGKISGYVVEAAKNSPVYSYYKDVVNASFYFVSFQVYAGVENAGKTLNNIVISNENGLLYTTGTNTSNNLTDTINNYGYIDVILDANVIDGVAKLSKATISVAGIEFEIEMELAPYVPEVLADESYAMGYIYGAYSNSQGVVESYIFNELQTIEENNDETIVSDKDNFSKLIASGSLAIVKENSNVDNLAPDTSSDHFITFRQYVGLQYAGTYVSETYAINGVLSEDILNIHVLGQNANNKNRVDDEGYLHYIFDADVSYLNIYGVWFYEKVNVETIQVFFTLDSETYEIRVDVKDLEVYNRTSSMSVMLGNMVDIGIENRLNTLSYSDEKYTISGRVYKVGETEEIKDNEIFYNQDYTATGYFVSYRIFTSKEDGSIKSLIGKPVTFEVAGYEGKTWCGGKVLANGYIEFITELLVNDGIIQNGELTLSYQVEGEETKTITLALRDLIIVEDKASQELAIKLEDFSVNGTGTGVNTMNYTISPVAESSYKVESMFFDKTAENSVAYNNPYAEENSTGYFVVFTAFAGIRAWGDTINVTLSYQKGGSEVKNETRDLEVNTNGYIGIFVDTMTEGTELGLDTLTLTFKNVDNETLTYTLDFSEIIVAQYETE